MDTQEQNTKRRLPEWFKQKIPRAGEIRLVQSLLADLKLHTVCEGAHCPNIGQCFSSGTATFMVLGNTCTRNCTFCAVDKGAPEPPDPDEPQHVAEAVKKLALKYVVVTCVTRDDIADGGAQHFADTITTLHREIPQVRVEVLVSDFKGSREAVRTVVESSPEVFAHNVETVPRLYPFVRPMADYRRSLDILKAAKDYSPDMITKSALMLGLGEERDEVIASMRDLRQAGCDLLTLGQYLAPSAAHHPVVRFVTPDEFSEYERAGMDEGFKGIASAPLVRSSFRAAELYDKALNKEV